MPRVTDLYMFVRECVCVHVINENKHHFQDFRYLNSRTLLIYPSDFNYFCHVGPFSSIFMLR